MWLDLMKKLGIAPPDDASDSNYQAPPSLISAFDKLRSAKSDGWVLATLDHLALVHVATALNGDADSLRAKLNKMDVAYALIRSTIQYDDDVKAIKYVFVSYLGPGVSVVRRAKISTMKGKIRDYFAPFHTEMLTLSSTEDCTNESVKLALSAGKVRVCAVEAAPLESPDPAPSPASGEKVVPYDESDRQEATDNVEKCESPPSLKSLPTSITTSATDCSTEPATDSNTEPPASPAPTWYNIVISVELASAIKNVRDNDKPTDWCLSTVVNSELRLVGSGSGGPEELAAALSPEEAYYGLLRRVDRIDASSTVKFVFISYQGSGLAPMARAKISTVKGEVVDAFAPFHVELLSVTSADEVSAEAIDSLIRATSHGGVVSDQVAQEESAPDAGLTAVGGRTAAANAAAVTLEAVDFSTDAPEAAPVSAEVAKSVASIHDDASPTTWAVFGYEDDSRVLRLVGSGLGANGKSIASEVLPLLDDAQCMHLLVRSVLQVDESSTVRFYQLSWVGEALAPMKKAKLSTVRGDVDALFSPVHENLGQLSTTDEVVQALSAIGEAKEVTAAA